MGDFKPSSGAPALSFDKSSSDLLEDLDTALSFAEVGTRALDLVGVEMGRILTGETRDRFKVTTPFTFQPAD